MCIECSGVHRSLGVHVSKVRSLALDSLTDGEYRLILSHGNERANQIWEKELEKSGDVKPNEFSDRQSRSEFIINKYVKKKFVGKVEGEKELSEVNGNCNEILCKEVYEAAKKGDLFAIATAIARGGSVNWTNEEDRGKSVLQICMESLKHDDDENSNISNECVELLVQNGAMISSLLPVPKKVEQ